MAKTAGLTRKGILPLHLRKKIWTAILGEEFWPTVLLFRRTKMERFFVEGKHIGLQCETKNGYLIISSDPSGFSSSFYVYIYYILKDFSDAEWGEIRGREWEPLGSGVKKWVEWRILHRFSMVGFSETDGPNPLESVIIRDDRNLVFKVRRRGWYLLTLHEDKLRRFMPSTFDYRLFQPAKPYLHYFKVSKLRSPPPEMPYPGRSAPNSSGSTSSWLATIPLRLCVPPGLSTLRLDNSLIGDLD